MAGISAGRRIVIFIGVLIALGGAGSGILRQLPPVPGLDPLVGREVYWWGLTLFILLYVLVVERRGLGSIGLKLPTWRTLVWGVAGAAVTLVVVGLGTQLLIQAFHLKQNAGAYAAIANTPLLYRVALVTRAAFAEEILFRGYPIERLQELLGSKWLAALITLAIFTYAHLSYWGPVQLLFAGGAGAVLTGLYLWRRDLGANILAHWIVDAVGLIFLAPHH